MKIACNECSCPKDRPHWWSSSGGVRFAKYGVRFARREG